MSIVNYLSFPATERQVISENEPAMYRHNRHPEIASSRLTSSSNQPPQDSNGDSDISAHAASKADLEASGFKYPKGQSSQPLVEIEPLECHCHRCVRALAEYEQKPGAPFYPPICCYQVGTFSNKCIRCVSGGKECLKMPVRHHRLVKRFRKHATNKEKRKNRTFRILRWRVRQVMESLKSSSKDSKDSKSENSCEPEEELHYRRRRDARNAKVMSDIANSLRVIAECQVRTAMRYGKKKDDHVSHELLSSLAGRIPKKERKRK